jgi:hypothetical protein
MGKIDWGAAAVLVPTLLALLGWGISIEVRLSRQSEAKELSTRIQNLETLMLPLLVDWKVEQELKKHAAEPPAPAPVLPRISPPKEERLRVDAKKWAEGAVQQRAPEK